jgi:crossover junction endodeoxyribonuclease RusA
MTFTIPLPWPKPPLSLNDRGHWAAKAARTKQARHVAHWVIQAWMAREGVTTLPAAELELVWRVPDLRRRDLDNPVATLKATTDGAVDAGLLDADDWRHVRRASVRIEPPSPDRTPAMWLEVTPREEWTP